MIFSSGFRSRMARNSIGPSISGITTSDTTRSMAPLRSSIASIASRPLPASTHSVAARAQTARVERAQALFVLDEKNGAVTGEVGGLLRDQRDLAVGGGGFLLGLFLRDMARQEDAEDGALARLGFDIDESAGLLDDAVNSREAEAGALADFLRREERLENLVDDLRSECRCRCRRLRPAHNPAAGMPLLAKRADSVSVMLEVRTVSLPPSGMASRALTARLTTTCSNWEMSTLTGHRSRPCTGVELHLLADQAAQQHGEIGQRVTEIQHLRPQRLPARERQQLPHQARRAVGVLLDLHDVLEGRIGRLVRVEQEVGRHHDGGQHVVEVVRDAAGELADGLHLLRLRELRFERPLLGGLQQIDDGGLGIAQAVFHRRRRRIAPSARRCRPARHPPA